MLDELINLAAEKNMLNMRRRRFGAWIRKNKQLRSYLKMTRPERAYFTKFNKLTVIPSCFNLKYVLEAYNKTKNEMKALTPKMRALRKQANAKIVWDQCNGNINAIQLVNGERINKKSFHQARINYLFETHILKS
jgi:hypothetical protein